ncbi:DUF6186 family protein [Microbacterium aureliae]
MSRAVTVAVYLVLLGVAAVLTVLPHRRPDVLAPVGDVLDDVTADLPARVALVAAWWWLGWHFLEG